MRAVITNSLASTDGILVHSKYRRYRKPLLPAGVACDGSSHCLRVAGFRRAGFGNGCSWYRAFSGNV